MQKKNPAKYNPYSRTKKKKQKNQSIETDSGWAQMLDLANDFKVTILNMLKK